MRKDEKKILHRALDGEVSRTETRFLRRRLEADERVRAEFEGLKKVVKDSGGLRIGVPPGFTRKVMKGVEETPRRIRPR